MVVDPNTLVTAAEARAFADDAELSHEQEAVARAINYAADTGAYEVNWTNPLHAETKELLESKGYAVIRQDKLATPQYIYIISWKE